MTIDDVRRELDRVVSFSNDLYRTRLLIRAYKIDVLPCKEDALTRLQTACDDYCTALANAIDATDEGRGGRQ